MLSYPPSLLIFPALLLPFHPSLHRCTHLPYVPSRRPSRLPSVCFCSILALTLAAVVVGGVAGVVVVALCVVVGGGRDARARSD